jgi:hypothetical protein
MDDPLTRQIDRWMKALAAARKAAAENIGPGKAHSQNAVAQMLRAHTGDATQQRTIGRFISDDKAHPRADTLFRIFAAVPAIGEAFENALSGLSADEAERASWSRIASRLEALMTVDEGLRLVDALEDLAALGNLDTTWPHLRRAAIDARRALAREQEEPADAKNMSR